MASKLVILTVYMATTWKDITKKRLTEGDWSLIIANLIPVIGVWFLGWSAKEVFLVYCLETVIVGLFTVLKLFITGMIKKHDDWENGGSVSQQPFLLFVFFFIVHYGFFVAIQTTLFFSFSGIGKENSISFSNFFTTSISLLNKDTWIMLGVFITSYAFRLLNDYILTGEYKTAKLGYIMFQPYGRIFIQQFTVIIGSIFLSFGAGKVFILVFAAIKIFFEVFIDFEFLIRKAAKGELKSTDET